MSGCCGVDGVEHSRVSGWLMVEVWSGCGCVMGWGWLARHWRQSGAATLPVCVGAVREGGVETSVCGFWLEDKEWAALGGGGCFGAHDASAPAAIITTQHTPHNQTITPLSTQTLFSTLPHSLFLFIQSLLDYKH